MNDSKKVVDIKTKKMTEAPKKFYLTKDERLEVQNLQLKRQMLEMQMRASVSGLEKDMENATKQINERLGIKIETCQLNFETGEVTMPGAEEPNVQPK